MYYFICLQQNGFEFFGPEGRWYLAQGAGEAKPWV